MKKPKFVGIPIVISEFLKNSGVVDIGCTELVLSSILYKLKSARQAKIGFAVEVPQLQDSFNQSSKKIRSAIQTLIELNLIKQTKILYSKTIYKIDLQMLLEKTKFSTLKELRKSKKIYIPQEFFYKITNKHGLSDLKLIHIYNNFNFIYI